MVAKIVLPEGASTKREAVLQTAIRIFAEQGYHNTDVQSIADSAGVGNGTVYRHFGKKEALFLAAVDSAMQRLEEHFYAAISGITNPFELLRAGAVAYAEFFEANPQLVELMIQERCEFRGDVPDTHLMYREKNREVFEQLLVANIAQGIVRPVDVKSTVIGVANLMYGTVVMGCIAGEQGRLKESLLNMVEVVIRGLQPPANHV